MNPTPAQREHKHEWRNLRQASDPPGIGRWECDCGAFGWGEDPPHDYVGQYGAGYVAGYRAGIERAAHACEEWGFGNIPIRALLDEPQEAAPALSALDVARTVTQAYAAGAEAMREAAAKWLEADGTLRDGGIAAIRALPLTGPPK